MIRSLQYFTLAALFSQSFFMASAQAAMLEIIPHVTTKEPVVYLSDLVSGDVGARDVALFQSPDPGQSGRISVDHVRNAAFRAGLFDFNDKGMKSIFIEREGSVVDETMVSEKIVQALREELELFASSKLSMTLDHPFRARATSRTEFPLLDVHALSVDQRSRRFQIVLQFDDTQQGRRQDTRVRLSGRYTVRHKTLKTTRNLTPGEIVDEGDFVWSYGVARALRNDGARTSIKSLVGLTPKHALQRGESVSLRQFRLPRLIRKGELVTIGYEQGTMQLTTRGKAIQSGSRGDVVAVQNLRSGQIVQAIARRPGYVVVSTPSSIASQ